MRFTFEAENAIVGMAANPAGDPRRLLTWLVNHHVAHGLTLEPGCVVTCGSYTGMYFPKATGAALGQINGLPPVKLALV
jgi:2-keto-4-pentenoate hydratase